MAENKTKATQASVRAFLDTIDDPGKREDAKAVCAMMERVSGEPATMWGPAIVGFGSYHYRYDSGREGDMCRVGFSPRAANLTLYISATSPRQADLLAKLGKHKTSKGCLYIKRLSDVHMPTLEHLIAAGWAEMAEKYPA